MAAAGVTTSMTVLGHRVGLHPSPVTRCRRRGLARRRRFTHVPSTGAGWVPFGASAVVVAYLLRGVGPDAWRHLFASPAAFAVITLLARLG
ncbi:hypothetical protein ACVWWN_004009 [Mycobacterium sp. URHB0021]